MCALAVVSSGYPSRRVQEMREKCGRNPYAPLATSNKSATYRAPIRYNPANEKGRRWIENASRGLRVRSAESIFRAGGCGRGYSTGWYTDNDANETTIAHIVAIPGKSGKPRYFAASSDPWNTGAYIVDFSSNYDNAEDAARGACQIAEWYSEECREGDMEYRAEQDIERAREEIADARAEHSAMIRERARAALAPYGVALDAMGQVCARARREVRAAVKVIRARRDNPATTLPGY